MSTDARQLVDAALAEVAPDLDPATFGPGDELRSSARLDSLDFLHLLAAVHHACGVDVPEADYPRVATYEGLVDYVQQALTTTPPRQ